jgi:hypothetical protein
VTATDAAPAAGGSAGSDRSASARPGVVARRIAAWLRRPPPIEALALVRILVAGYTLVRLLSTAHSLLASARLPAPQFVPVGVLSTLAAPVAAGWVGAALVAVVALAALALMGVAWRVVGPALAVGFLILTTYGVSWGHVGHADHLVALHLVVLALVPAADTWAWRHRRAAGGSRRRPPRPERTYVLALRLLAFVTVVSYVVAGVAKVRYGGTGWFTGDVLRAQIATDALQKTLLGAAPPLLARTLLPHAWLFPPMAWMAVLVELGAPVALVSGRWARSWSVAAWLFHVGVAVVMGIVFPYPLCAVAFAPVVLSVPSVNLTLRRRSSTEPGDSGRMVQIA